MCSIVLPPAHFCAQHEGGWRRKLSPQSAPGECLNRAKIISGARAKLLIKAKCRVVILVLTQYLPRAGERARERETCFLISAASNVQARCRIIITIARRAGRRRSAGKSHRSRSFNAIIISCVPPLIARCSSFSFSLFSLAHGLCMRSLKSGALFNYENPIKLLPPRAILALLFQNKRCAL